MQDIQERAAQIKMLGEQHASFAEKLHQLAANFEAKAILALLTQYMDK